MNRTTRTFNHTDSLTRTTFTSDAYTEDGLVWRWASNNAVVPLDAAADYGIPVDAAAQAAARDAELTAFVAEYRKNRTRRISTEERFEMLAAFGPGVRVVNILTGERTRT